MWRRCVVSFSVVDQTLRRRLTTSSASSASSNEVFEKLLKNITSRFGSHDKGAVYKALVDLHDNHFHFRQEQIDFALSRLGDGDKSLLATDPYVLVLRLLAEGQQRGSLIFDGNRLVASHPQLDELADRLNTQNDLDFEQHEGLFFQVGRRTKSLLGTFIWRTTRGQACGGIRLWKYDTLEAYLRDGLRLAVGSGRKAALAGLWVGGGKGVIARPGGQDHRDEVYRRDLFQDYGEFVTSLRGCYISSEDVGLNDRDMDWVYSHSRFTTCISPSLGGSGNPSIVTARGVVCAMEAALDFLNAGSLENKKVAVQGMGNVGLHLIKRLLSLGVASVVATDVDASTVDVARRQLQEQPVDLRLVDLNDTSILAEPCDILIPNALGGIFNAETIPTIQAKVICGAASNQLSDESSGRAMVEKGITFVPDVIASRMGMVSSANEQYGQLDDDPAIERHFARDFENGIFQTTRKVLQTAKSEGITPTMAAHRLADVLAQQVHPLWPNRGKMIIEALARENWHQKAVF